MSDNGSAELAVLLAQLTAHDAGPMTPPPSPSEAMAIYLVAARLVELQLQLADRGESADEELAMTTRVLAGTHRILRAALDSIDAPGDAPVPQRRPTLQMVHGGRAGRRRPPNRSYG